MAGNTEAGDSLALLARWRDGDQQAAAELFGRYAERLIGLAQRRLSDKLAARVDPEDVVQSVYGSFFAGAKNGRFVLQRSGDLWPLLVAITLHKVRRQARHHTAQKRSINREEPHGSQDHWLGMPAELLAQEPSPDEAVALTEMLEAILRSLKPVHRRMVELRLQGHTIPEIAVDTQRCLATVEEVLRQVKERLSQDLGDANR
jgi:DNA-directed RNA polymerase specialized sigma24 family protein